MTRKPYVLAFMNTVNNPTQCTTSSEESLKSVMGFFLVFLLLATKSPDALTIPQFWAEDGVVFFKQQYEALFVPLITPYAGYMHVIPRIVAFIGRMVSYAQVPLLYNLATLLIETASILYFCRRASFLAPAWIVASAFFLVPTNGEEFGTLTNVQWFLQFALFGATLFPKDEKLKGRSHQFARSAAILLIALTGPFSIFCTLIGLVLWTQFAFAKYVSKRTSDEGAYLWIHLDHQLFAITAAGAIAQAATLTFGPPRHYYSSGNLSIKVAKELLFRGTQQHIFGASILSPLGFAIVLLVSLTSALLLLRSNSRIKAMACVAMLTFSVIQILGVSYEKNWILINPFGMDGDRYYFFLKVTIWLCIAATLNTMKESSVILLVPLLLIYFGFRNPNLLQRPTLTDMHWKQMSQQLKHRNEPIDIPINPAPWHVTISPAR